MNSPIALGIDLSGTTLQCALATTPAFRHESFPNSTAGLAALNAWLARRTDRRVHICIAVTGAGEEGLADDLERAGHDVSLIHAMWIRAYAQAVDPGVADPQVNASTIACFCRDRRPVLWTSSYPDQRQLLELLQRHLPVNGRRAKAAAAAPASAAAGKPPASPPVAVTTRRARKWTLAALFARG